MSERICCMLLHGYGGSPFEMGYLGERLAGQGWAVDRPVLPGHGTSVREFARTRFADWAEAVRTRYDELAGRYDRVFVAGLSMGGSLGLWLARQRDLPGLATVAAPVYVYRFFPYETPDWRLPLIPALRWVRPVWRTGPPDPRSREIAPWQGYEGVQLLHPLHSLLQGLREVRSGLAEICAPLLVLHSPGDRTAPVGNAWEIMGSVGSPVRRMELLPIRERITGHHLLTTHMETRERVADAVVSFFQDRL
jgi:carboxylesterase